jgi:3-deoxy-D-manno-octulosonate 8-phosphate phosphatase (KDO 8-P phosphatase)
MTLLSPQLQVRAQNICLLGLDVDGVLTSGAITLTPKGDELKSFYAQDGMGLRMLMDAGFEIAIITRRVSNTLEQRLKELNIHNIYQGQQDKRQALFDIKQKQNVTSEHIAFAGDDLPDIGVMREVGLALTVANACYPVPYYAHWQSSRAGGCGAVREICELLLCAQNIWQTTLDNYL